MKRVVVVMRSVKSRFYLFVFVLSVILLNPGCQKSLPNPTQIKNTNDEAAAFRKIASSHATYEIEFFDLTDRKIPLSYADESVLKSVARIRIKIPNGKAESYQVIDVENLKLLLNE